MNVAVEHYTTKLGGIFLNRKTSCAVWALQRWQWTSDWKIFHTHSSGERWTNVIRPKFILWQTKLSFLTSKAVLLNFLILFLFRYATESCKVFRQLQRIIILFDKIFSQLRLSCILLIDPLKKRKITYWTHNRNINGYVIETKEWPSKNNKMENILKQFSEWSFISDSLLHYWFCES